MKKYVAGEEMFLANYADGLTDLPLDEQLAHFRQHDAVASFLCVKPNLSYHAVPTDGERAGHRASTTSCDAGVRVNGGFFVFKQAIFDYMRDGEELVLEPFQRLIKERKLAGVQLRRFLARRGHRQGEDGVDDLFAAGNPPWEVWNCEVVGLPAGA